jgi:hypothetical protein
MNTVRRRPSAIVTMALVIGLANFSVSLAAAQPTAPAQRTFASPDAAIKALRAAAEVHDKAALKDIFGPQVHELLTGDDRQDKANSQHFAKAMAEGANPIPEGDGRIILEIGSNRWPFPIPLVKENAVWRFDTAAGKEEIINRHIGKDELHAISICASYVQARNAGGAVPVPKPVHGYVFKLLPPQAAGGFALAAYPEHWGKSGIMTFVVNQDGIIDQRDIGEKTSQLAAGLTGYNPDDGWTPVKDQGILEK